MAYEKEQAARLVIAAGHRLLEAGLAARTWGNISARLSDTQFLITPSGRAYETLTPADLVAVNIADGAYSGEIKPSSEKGVHAESYRCRPDVNFVIHTHQLYATAYGVLGETLETEDPLLGGSVPCAAYGISSTEKLRRNVAAALRDHPAANALFMRNHGALCLGLDCEGAFAVSLRLEELCRREVTMGLSLPEDRASQLRLPGELAPLLPAAYVFTAAPAVLEISRTVHTLYPVIDDMAQIGGVSIECVDSEGPGWEKEFASALRGRNAVLLRGRGALCTGDTPEDARAVTTVLEKNCLAALYGEACGKACRLGRLDALLQRTVYVTRYAKLK